MGTRLKGEPMTTYNTIKLNENVVIEKHLYDGYNGESIDTWRIDSNIDSTELADVSTKIYKFNGTRSVQLDVVTHDGAFHPDEVIAIALLKIAGLQFDVIRSRRIENILSADILVDVGSKYSPADLEFDHHQFEKSHALYGKSSAGLIADWLFYDIPEDFRKFIAAVDARDTRVAYHQDNEWEPMLDDITACNQLDINSSEQNDAFDAVLKLVEDFIYYRWFAKEENKKYSLQAKNELHELAMRINNEKIDEFAKRRNKAVISNNCIYGEYYPEWTQDVSENYPLFVTWEESQAKVMVNTDICKIVDILNKEFVHANGFIAVSNDLAPTVTIEYTDGTVKTMLVPYLRQNH